MQILQEYIQNFWVLANEMAIYILFGIFFAALLKQLIPEGFVKKHLGKSSVGSTFKAALFGIPLPLCSCSVIPFAASLKKEGASSGSVLSFLIATPITGVDSILATYGFFGWAFTLYRVISSFVIAIIAGVLQNLFGIETQVHEEPKSCCSGGSCCNTTEEAKKSFSIKKMVDYALFDVLADFAKPLFWGLLLGAAITTFMPKDLADFFSKHQALSYMLILLISLPLYICATASLPIAAGLVASGLSGGAAFILLSAGPATNSVTMGVVLSLLGKRALFIYLTIIASFSLLFGYLFDIFFSFSLPFEMVSHHESTQFIAKIATLVLFILMAYVVLKKRDEGCHD